jgi:hypothetical protein
MLFTRRPQKLQLSERDAARVADLLADEFDHDDMVRQVVFDALVAGVEPQDRHAFEVILDSPLSARFRLRWRACPRVSFTPQISREFRLPSDDRVDDVNSRLDALLAT